MIGNFNPDEFQQALDLTDRFIPVLLIALGKPDEQIVLTEVGEDGVTDYYRDENDIHYVPKRSLQDILL